MTHPWLRPPASWPALADELVVALLRLPADRTLELLTVGTAVTLEWLLPERALLVLHDPSHRSAAAVAERGWVGGRTVAHGHDRAVTARAAAQEAVPVLRDVVGVRPGQVELWWPCTPAPPLRQAPAADGEPPW